ncbi:MAG: SDR family NAD(P)-dependent oxidoreductase [Bacteroidetes bacterium]|nr:SDR family NAD(P)-dependent oxidoreductase [Bacteroidota bacterium]
MNVVITGASRGLGKAIAEIFAANGHSLLLCSRNEATLFEAKNELVRRFPAVQILAKAADLSRPAEADAFGQWVIESGYEVDVLVNNAGSFIPGDITTESEGALEEMMAVNLFSAYHLTRKLLPAMIARKQGHIFNMCSIASLQAYPGGGAYSISKFALLGFSKNLRLSLRDKAIKVTTVMPGATYTDSWRGSGVDPKRIMEASDIAKMVFAASQLSAQACVEEITLRPQLGDL